MSAQPQTMPRHRRHPSRRRHGRRGRDAAVAPPMASPSLSWITPPRLRCDLAALTRQLEPRLLAPHPELRRGFSAWFLHMLELGLLTPKELTPITSAEYGISTWETLYRTSQQRLATELNDRIHAYDTLGCEPCASSVTMSLQFRDDVALLLTLEGYCEFEVDSLHRQSPQIAEWAYTTLELISICLSPCLTPSIMWDGDELGWVQEERREEYRQLVEIGGLKNVGAAAELVRTGNFQTFSDDEEKLAEELDRAHEMFEGRPVWMRSFSGKPITSAQELRASARRYHTKAPLHPWVQFVHDACDVLCQRFEDDGQFSQEQAIRQRAIQPCEDNEAFLSSGLWVFSGSPPEVSIAEDFYECMNNAGESPVLRIGLVGLPSMALRRILHDLAQGIGLLFRAHTINEYVCKSLK